MKTWDKYEDDEVELKKLKVLYFNTARPESHCYRYRIANIQDAFEFVGAESRVTNEVELFNNPDILLNYDLLVIFRAIWTENIREIVRKCRILNIPVIFDIDDYLFEPAIANGKYISAIKYADKKSRQEFEGRVRGLRQTFMECDYFTASTRYLADLGEKLGKESFVINNGLSWKFLEISSHLRFVKNNDETKIVEIVYMSGSDTHHADFAVVVPVLKRVLHENDNVYLFIFGHLCVDKFQELKPFTKRIRKQTPVKWQEMHKYVGNSHINIAPLETGNPFCEAKSELKYFEAAAFGLVTVASATSTFKEAIIDGQTGYVCKTEEEWYDRLTKLIKNKGLRDCMTQNAIIHASTRYHPVITANQASGCYREIIKRYRAKQKRKQSYENKTLNTLNPIPIPDLEKFGYIKTRVPANHTGQTYRKENPETEFTFNIIYTPGTVKYLSLFVMSLLKWSDCSFRLVTNGCRTEEKNYLKEFCNKYPRLEFMALHEGLILSHGQSLNYLQRMTDSNFFCFMDSDIFATGPFMEEFISQLNRYNMFFSGVSVWQTEQGRILPDNFQNVFGRYSKTDKGVCLGSSYFAIYNNRTLTEFIRSAGIDFDQCLWTAIKREYQKQLTTMGLKKEFYDTGKLLNLLLLAGGERFFFSDSPFIRHLGGVSVRKTINVLSEEKSYARSHVMKDTAIRARIRDETEEHKKVQGKIQILAPYFAQVLDSLFRKHELPEIPDIKNAETETKIKNMTDEIVSLYKEFGGAFISMQDWFTLF